MKPSSVLAAASVPFLEDIYARYRADPASIDPSWTHVFLLVDELMGAAATGGADAVWIANTLRQGGHRMAAINPLLPSSRPTLASLREQATLATGEVPPAAAELRARYCGSLGVESAHVDDDEVAAWIRQAVETAPAPDAQALHQAHRKLVEAEELEAFLGKKFPGKKRFGAEGAEALVALLDRLLRQAAADGVRHVVIGTMHRGRLNLLANVLGKPLEALLAEFKGAFPFAPGHTGSADVSYHLGFETTLPETGLAVTLLPNPSHLEAVDAVVAGRVRALQDQLPADQRGRVLGIVLHTDAAVVGQGVVAELLQLSRPDGFTTGGTVHVVVNNQLGFTTEPAEGRTSRYCTGPWKAIDSLILHANGDDADAVLRAADLAIGFRQALGRDCVIDLVCYRRNGHNEMDEPRFTQPGLYQVIERMAGARMQLEARLTEAGLLSEAEAEDRKASCRKALELAYVAMPGWRAQAALGALTAAGPARAAGVPCVSQEVLQRLLTHLAAIPDHVKVDVRLQRLVRQRAVTDKGLPWAVGEALAFGSLLLEGVPVRLSGQDVVRGAFSHRNFALTDVDDGKRYVSLQHVPGALAPFSVSNSPLSEYAVLGFEYGYSLGSPQSLTIWEAQFGDFANGAQIMVDQFIVSGEEKWDQRSSLVMLLPHGLEGQGPEHSSARVERYLQLAALDNMRIAIPTTPANYFHLLRRQAHDLHRKPLVVFAPKTLLRLPAAVSALEDFAAADGFRPLLVSPAAGSALSARRLLLCCGKVAYALERERERRGADDAVIVRLEQLYPMPEAALGALFRAHPDAGLVWVQEEPANMGAWHWLDRRLENLARDSGHRKPRVRYCGRPEAASPAGSFHEAHAADQERIVAAAFA